MLWPRPYVFSPIPIHLPLLLRYPRNLIAIGFGLAAVAGITTYFLTRQKLTPAEIEHARRNYLAETGRITDGSITETQWLAEIDTDGLLTTPCVLIYRYRIGGVTYECAQDVTPLSLSEYVHHVRIDLPVQVRFDPRNPGNSIVVAESWSGLRLHAPASHSERHHD